MHHGMYAMYNKMKRSYLVTCQSSFTKQEQDMCRAAQASCR